MSIQFVELHEVAGMHVKIYGVSAVQALPQALLQELPEELLTAAKREIAPILQARDVRPQETAILVVHDNPDAASSGLALYWWAPEIMRPDWRVKFFVEDEFVDRINENDFCMTWEDLMVLAFELKAYEYYVCGLVPNLNGYYAVEYRERRDE